MSTILHKLLPFLRWFPMTRQTLRLDVISGITVALVLVPQSMAYALLAGLPVVYGLYASLLPVILGSLFGSFNLLHTGPVVLLSLMSLAAITPFAQSPEQFIELSIMLALMIGVLRLTMGVFRLGALVNLVSVPVIVASPARRRSSSACLSCVLCSTCPTPEPAASLVTCRAF